ARRAVHLVMGLIAFFFFARYDYHRLVEKSAGRAYLAVLAFLSFLFTGKLDSLGAGWQLDQSLIALGSGGLFGRGYGRSLQKFLFLPDPHTDFIVAILGEEGGLIATAGLLALLVAFLARGYRAAFRAPDDLGYLVAAGITTQLAAYTFVNMGVATGLFPTT